MASEKVSPGMKQYLDIKRGYPDTLLLFRMGDFYELFYEDAVNASKLLGITLTSRNKKVDNPVPMAGIPCHSVQQYIDVLIDAGCKVAIAEQLDSAPNQVSGVMKREVVQVITPGTVVDSTRETSQNNFLVALDCNAHGFGLAYMDVVTGEFYVTEVTNFSDICGEIRNLRAREIVIGCQLSKQKKQILEKKMNLLLSYEERVERDSRLIVENLKDIERSVAGKLLKYVRRTQLRELCHLKKVCHYQAKDFLQMDYATKASLDLMENSRTGKKYGSLYWFLDETQTAMGARLLQSWIHKPLVDQTEIKHRQAIVSVFLQQFFERSDLIENLKNIYDLDRLTSRVSFGKVNPKDLLNLALTLGHAKQIKISLQSMKAPILQDLIDNLDDLPDLYNFIKISISENASAVITEGNIIQTGFNETLDRYRIILRDGTSWIAEVEAKEREASGISNLKIDYNKRDGYYFHVTNSQLKNVPSHFFRKATLKNSKRFGTEELVRIEGEILEARDESIQLEYEIFMRIRKEVSKYIKSLQKLSLTLSIIDVLQSFASIAENHNLVCPIFTRQGRISIRKGRHAVIEKTMGSQTYIPNDIELDENTTIQLITGPNMSGKSTYMRQLAIIVLMAQVGSYVSAEAAELPIFDAVFTRIGASDDLVLGQSTFMVEMMEASNAIRHASKQSLILFDELGRGTSTYDGMALAQAIIEHIHDQIGSKTLFATHYHELTNLGAELKELKNVHVETMEEGGQVTFLHTIKIGATDKSYGVHVARIAGLPETLLKRAECILETLEGREGDPPKHYLISCRPVEAKTAPVSLTLSEDEGKVLKYLKDLDLLSLTPLQVVSEIDRLKSILQ